MSAEFTSSERGTTGQIGVPIITVDGPSGSGKGTLAVLLAERLGWHYLDSGALYRILGVYAEAQSVALDDAEAVAQLAAGLEVRFDGEQVFVFEEDMTNKLRNEEAGALASQVAAHLPVRAAIVDLQRSFATAPGLVADGRDMGTEIFADAPLKIFLDASAQVRAERRYNQLKNKGLVVSLRDLLKSIQERDERDRARTASPLRPAQDAIVLDSSNLSIDAVLKLVLTEVEHRGLGSA
ncbi:MAG: (d)CMP kinase [Pseudomonadales bacterium]